MKATDIPARQPVPFAANAASANKRAIPATQPAGSPGQASYSTGFPPETMQPIASGGTPPFGSDFNGLLNDLSTGLRWKQAGGQYLFDATFASAIGGYPAGALLKSSTANLMWLNTMDSNSTDPDSSSASGWLALRANTGIAAITAAAGNVSPTSTQLGALVLNVTGTLTANASLVLPLSAGATWTVANNTTGSFNLSVIGATGSGVNVPQGNAIIVFTDGTNFYAASASVAGQYLPINGTAVAATKLATPRNFSLGGTGSIITSTTVQFDGTGDVMLNAAMADGALTIAKTSGLQTALDGKLGLGGGTVTGSLSVTQALTVGYLNNFPINSTAGPLLYESDSTNHSMGLRVGPSSGYKYFSFGYDGSFNVLNGNLTVSANATINGGISVGNSTTGSSSSDISHGIALWGTSIGFGVTGSRLNYVVPASNNHVFVVNGADILSVNSSAVSSTVTLSVGTGAVGTQQILTTFGWNNGIGRLKQVIESDASYSIYSYDTAGGSASQVMNLNSSGDLTVHRNLTVGGTGNFQGSDVRIKENVVVSAPRPLHREISLCNFTMKDSGEKSRGLLAQALKRATGGDYVGTFQHKDGERLSVNYAGTALEIAMWAANEVDRVRSQARMERWGMFAVMAVLAVTAIAKVL